MVADMPVSKVHGAGVFSVASKITTLSPPSIFSYNLITQTLILSTMPNVTESNEVERFQSRLLSLFNVNKGGIAYEGR